MKYWKRKNKEKNTRKSNHNRIKRNVTKKLKTKTKLKNKLKNKNKYGGIRAIPTLTTNAYSSSSSSSSLKSSSLALNPRQKYASTPRSSPTSKPNVNIQPTFISTEGEDDLEASISFLLELMGSSLYETYVEEILNTESNQNIKVVQVPRPINPPPSFMIPGQPKIFYGSSKGTHFTCTMDGVNIWNSYRERIQLLNTDHFCQTFTLMRMQYQFLPDSFVGREYTKLQEYQYLDNVMVAINVACYIIELLQKDFNIEGQVDEFLQLRDHKGNPVHIKNPAVKIKNIQQLITNLISYCRSITKEQLCNSTFKQKIFML